MTDPAPGAPPAEEPGSAEGTVESEGDDAEDGQHQPGRSRLARPLGLRGTLAAFFVVITVLPLVSSVVLLGSQLEGLLGERGAQQLRAQANAIAEVLSQRSARAGDLADDLARRLAADQARALADRDVDALEEWLDDVDIDAAVPGRADVVALLDADGELLAARGSQADVEVLRADETSKPRLIIARRRIVGEVDGSAGTLVGELVAAYRLDADALEQLGVDGAALLSDGDVVAVAPEGPPPDPVPAAGQVVDAEQGSVPVSAVGVEVGETRLVLWNAQPERPAVMRSTVAVLVPAIALAATLGFVLADRVAAPIGRAAATARAIATGDLDRRVEPGGPREVHELADALNRMARELQARLDQLHASRDELAGSLERIGRSLASGLDLDETLGVVAESAVATLAADGAVVYLLEEQSLRPAVRAGSVTGALEPVALGQGVAGHVAQVAAPRRLPDGVWEADAAEPPAGARLVVPMVTGTRVRGVLAVLRADAERPFDDPDLETLRTFATQAAVALENVDRHEEAARQAVTDPLTGLPNARFLQYQLEREVSSAQRYERNLALLVCDLDHFKGVNDTYGHDAGDVVLIEVATRFQSVTRAPDVVARVGGEEFVVLLPGADEEGARATAERLRSQIAAEPIDLGLGRGAVTVTISTGVAVRADGEAGDELRRRADEALYAAKRDGRNRSVVARGRGDGHPPGERIRFDGPGGESGR